jgi:hypothetical protein
LAGKSRKDGGRSGGANRKSNATHVEQGTFRGDRHGDVTAYRSGRPEPVLQFGEAGRRLWESVLDNLPPSAVATCDTFKLSLLAQSWERLQQQLERWTADPADRDARLACNQLSTLVNTLAAQFGCSPKDRTRMSRVDWGKDEGPDPFQQFMRGEFN